MTTDTPGPERPEPPDRGAPAASLWMRGLRTPVPAALFGLAQGVPGIATVPRFVPVLVKTRAPAPRIRAFGASPGRRTERAARVRTAARTEKPFPWTARE